MIRERVAVQVQLDAAGMAFRALIQDAAEEILVHLGLVAHLA